MSLSVPDYLLWVVGELLLGLTCGALLKRKMAHKLPVFFAYSALQVLRTAGLFAVHLLTVHQRVGYAEYFYSYWAVEAVSIVLGFTVIYEIYCKMFQNYDAVRHLGSIMFGGGAVVLLLAAVLTAASASGADAPGIVRAIVLLERSVHLMQCGLVLFLFLAALHLGLAWQNYLFGIGMGFGVLATIELAAIAVRFHVGSVADGVYSQVRAAAYDTAVLIWVCYLLAPQRAPQYSGMVHHHELDKWNQALLEMLQR
jgi:hypothetical protein